jgi:hypothetical protein
MHELDAILLCVSVLAILGLGLVALRMYWNGQERKHERDHLERMKALEMGFPLSAPPIPPARASGFRLARLMGGVVPVGAFVSSALASSAVGFHDGMWIATCIVGLGSVICGTVLACFAICPTGATSTDAASESFSGYKPAVEEDAYDVVSARG